MQTTGSLGVSYIVFRSMKQLLSKHVPEKWLQVEEEHMNKVNELANKMTERLQESLPNIPETTRNNNIILRTIYESFQKVKVYEIAVYLLTILVVIILPPLLSVNMDKKKKAAIEAFEKKQKKEKDEDEEDKKNQKEIEQLGDRLENMRQDEKKEEQARKDQDQDQESETVQEEEENLSNRSINKDTEEIRLSLTKEERQKLKEEEEREQSLLEPDVTEIDEVTKTEPHNEFLVSPALHHPDQDETELKDNEVENKVEYEQQNFIDKVDPMRENDGVDLEHGFNEIDHIVSPLEPEIIEESVHDISADNIDPAEEVHEETVQEQDEVEDEQELENNEEKETLEPEQAIVLEKTAEQPRTIPSLTNPTAASFDSQSSLHTQVLFPSANSSSYIQFSPTKTSDLKVEINKKNAYSQPFEY